MYAPHTGGLRVHCITHRTYIERYQIVATIGELCNTNWGLLHWSGSQQFIVLLCQLWEPMVPLQLAYKNTTYGMVCGHREVRGGQIGRRRLSTTML